jgi:hypothetical protein
MPQYNLFGEVEIDVMPEPEPLPEIPEPVFMPPIMRKSNKRKSFEIGKCKRCGQLLLNDPDNTRIQIDDELCPNCDTKLRARYDSFRNLALIKALRIHKYLTR